MGRGHKLTDRDGVWYVRRSLNKKDTWTSTGYFVKGGKAAKKSAELKMYEILTDDRNGDTAKKRAQLTFAAWWEKYRTRHLILKAVTTQARDTIIMERHALPFFGAMILDDVKKSDCLQYMGERRARYRCQEKNGTTRVCIAEGTVQRERRVIQAVFQQAIEDGHKFENPWKGIERVKDKVRDRVVTEEEQVLILAQLDPEFQRCFLTLLRTGLRIDELRNIDYERDIDWVRSEVTVTGKGRKVRQVPIRPDDVAPLLREQWADKGRLWTQHPNSIRERFKGAARRAGIPHVTPHTMRHTFGHRWLKGGNPMYQLSQILGHASIAITESHYAHLLKEDLHAAMNAARLG